MQKQVSATPVHDSCFLDIFDTTPCSTSHIAGTLLGIRIEERNGIDVPIIGVHAGGTARAVIELSSGHIAILRRLESLPAESLRKITISILHLQFIRTATPANAPAFSVYAALPATLLIIEPDMLLNITDLSTVTMCVRLDTLRRIHAELPTSAGLRGSIIHAIFKDLLKNAASEPAALLEEYLQSSVVDLAEVHANEQDLRAEMLPHLQSLDGWRTQQSAKLFSSDPKVRAETFLMAPEIGLKGRLDILWEDATERRMIELKTGRTAGELPRFSHRWQVHGYQALLAARRNGDTRNTLTAMILYSGVQHIAAGYGIPGSLREIQRVIELRNDLVLTRISGTVPPPPGGKRCEKCYMHTTCLTLSPLLQWTPPPTNQEIHPVDTVDAEWFQRWYSLQVIEAHASEEETRQLWRLSAGERVALGLALTNLTLAHSPITTERHDWLYQFHCNNVSEFREGDEVLLSDGDPIRGEVVSGSVVKIGQNEIAILAREFHSNPTFIDRYNLDVMSNRMLQNLERWLHTDQHRRELIRGNGRVSFTNDMVMTNPQYIAGLNIEQTTAVMRALEMRDYLLIQGPPGTGKTNVIAAITRALLGRGLRVALAAYTNQATDTMLSRVIAFGVTNALRLGHEPSIAPALWPYRVLPRAKVATQKDHPSADEVRAVMRNAPVVAATVATWSAADMDIEHPLPLFDVVIVDEATQLTVPAVLGALRWGRRFILVGDEKQLPPLVQSELARGKGLGESLFEFLLPKTPSQASIMLRRQYRMHQQICAIASELFYGGTLVTDIAIAENTLAAIPSAFPAILSPEPPVIWIDTPIADHGQARINHAEATAIVLLVQTLLHDGLPAGEIGVIAPYRAQVAAIRQLLGSAVEDGVTIDTIDRFQGAERSVILLSLVGSTQIAHHNRSVTFLHDARRLNVALTRAKQKLILLGAISAFPSDSLVGKVAQRCIIVPWSER